MLGVLVLEEDDEAKLQFLTFVTWLQKRQNKLIYASWLRCFDWRARELEWVGAAGLAFL